MSFGSGQRAENRKGDQT